MNDISSIKIHWSFWLVCTLALLWNVGGSINYYMQTNFDFVAKLPETHQAIITGRPIWATAGFAIGVFGGAIGCILLLLRKSYALNVFILSFVGIAVTMIHTVNIAISKIDFTITEIIIMIILPLLVAVSLIVYTKNIKVRMWLN